MRYYRCILIIVATVLLASCSCSLFDTSSNRGDKSNTTQNTPSPNKGTSTSPTNSEVRITSGSIEGYRQTDYEKFTEEFEIDKKVSN